jgi:hypothetical protein
VLHLGEFHFAHCCFDFPVVELAFCGLGLELALEELDSDCRLGLRELKLVSSSSPFFSGLEFETYPVEERLKAFFLNLLQGLVGLLAQFSMKPT